MKKCSKCKISKDSDLFYKDKSRKDGLNNRCKECESSPEHKKICRERDAIKCSDPLVRAQKVKKQRFLREKYREKHIFRIARYRARQNGLEFSIEPSDIVIPEYCPLLGIKLKTNIANKNRECAPSIDRIDNSKGYIKGNIAVISWKANSMKRDMAISELRLFVSNLDKYISV